MKKRRLLRDMGLLPAYDLYTLLAFIIATALCLCLSRALDALRGEIYDRYRSMGEVYTISLGDELDVQDGQITYGVLYDNEGDRTATFSKDRGGFCPGERPARGNMLQVVLVPDYAGEDRLVFLMLGAVQLLLVPLCYGSCTILCAALFYRRRLAGALRTLEDAVAQIAAGRLDFTVAYGRDDEMGRLCVSFETMRSALLDNQRTLWRQMEERGRLNAAFSHDLRTPLTVLKGHAGMLLSSLPGGELTNQEILDEVRVMELHIERLEGYVEAMARLHRLEDLEVRREPVDSGLLLAGLRDTAEILRGDKAVAWSVYGGGTWRVDQEVVSQVCENLLANAFRHSRTKVDVTVSAEDGSLCVVVSDDGQGFTRRALERATDPFYQESSGGRMGMGLHICKLLCERHGGELSICNNAKGGGLACASFAME